jgi:DNA-binding Lrp family transcriptional regulator
MTPGAQYRAGLQCSRVGLDLTVFIGVKIDGHANDRAEAFEEAIVAMPEVVLAISSRVKWIIYLRSWSPTLSPIRAIS